MSTKLTDFFSKERIDQVARDTEFVKRERTICGSTFAEALIFSKFDNSKISLEELAETFTVATKKEITKQAINLRFTPESVAFFKKLIELSLQDIHQNMPCYTFLTHFAEVRIKDSTCFQLPTEMADKYPGSGGASSKASIRIQFEYDIKTGKIIDLSLHAFNDQDIKNATKTTDDISENVLILRDLGYTSIDAIRAIKDKKASFISRLIAGVNVYQSRKNAFVKVDFRAVYRYLKRYNLQSIEQDVYITEEKEPVRMIIELMPEKEVEHRLEKAEKEAKKKGRKLSEEYKARTRLNIFITNVGYDILDCQQIHKVYTLRWQVELIFKIWKSIGEIHKVKKMKIERFESFLYAKLLWLMINWGLVWQINQHIHFNSDKLLSFYKAYKSLKNRIKAFQMALLEGKQLIRDFIEEQVRSAFLFHLLDKKKDKESIYELIKIM